ncbi:MAG: ATP synthase subunit I [Desulfobacteraceae bacterium]|nr:MAG: ATP synthase subunit I [Desulfobacteraceae bacterium]
MSGVFASTVWAFAAGILSGTLYFGGLWLSIRRLGRVRRPGLLLAASFALRATLSCVVFFLFARRGLTGLSACVAGFILVRLFWVYRLRPTPVGPVRARNTDETASNGHP